jgi:hypothetical protein
MRTWRPSTDPNASLVLEPAVTPGPGIFTVGAYGHYAFHPVSLLLPDNSVLRPVAHVIGLDAIANFGIGQRLAVGATVPIIAYQYGASPLPASVSQTTSIPKTGFGDIGLSVKGALVRNEQGGFGLAALGGLTLPTGDRAGFAGESGPTATARLLAEYTLLVAAAQASIGYTFRSDHHTWPDAAAGGVRFADEIPWSVAFAMRPGVLGIDPGNRQRLELGLHGWVPAGPVGPFGTGDPGSAALSPVQLALSDRIELGHYRDAFVTIGGEIGLTQAVGVPTFRAVLAIGWTPRAHDLDGDGIKDDIDGCPEIPEDFDGFEDADGCPEIDNDEDGIIDREDACPNVKGVPSKDPRKNGCPMEDADGDGVEDSVDACPREKGVPSPDPKKNGCPPPPEPAPDPNRDTDGDGIRDKDDACPIVKGVPSSDPEMNGCPNPDRDGDTFDNDVDKCPDSAEVFNGIDDEDGCPDEGGKPLVVIDDKRRVRVATPVKLIGPSSMPEVDPSSLPTLRALALELNRHPDWTLAVGTRPGASNEGQLDALARSFAIVRTLSGFSRRDGLAETIGWDAVKTQPGADKGIGFLLLINAGAAAPATPPLAPPLPLPPHKP